MKEGEIILHLLLPPNEEPTGAIEPGMAAFHHPAAGTITRDELFLSLLFSPTAHVRLGMPCKQFLVDRSRVVGSIQAHLLGMLRCGLGSADDQTIQGGSQQAHVMTISSSYDHSQRNSCSISQQAALGSLFAAIGRVGSGRGAGLQGLSS
jgi:hypothetical protein